jgi:hypothetical protein
VSIWLFIRTLFIACTVYKAGNWQTRVKSLSEGETFLRPAAQKKHLSIG